MSHGVELPEIPRIFRDGVKRIRPGNRGLIPLLGILDELSYMSFNKYESELLFKVISERSERSSTIVTTNLSFSEWTQLFENTTMVAALVDGLTYRSHVLDMSGPSYRLLTAQAENEAATTAGNTAG